MQNKLEIFVLPAFRGVMQGFGQQFRIADHVGGGFRAVLRDARYFYQRGLCIGMEYARRNRAVLAGAAIGCTKYLRCDKSLSVT